MPELRTPLFDAHVALGARMTAFAGWSMPLHYGSQLREHQAVRSSAGIFDVSHMTVIDIEGGQALDLLHRTFASDAAKADQGRAVYGVLLNENAGILDDLIVYPRPEGYRAVVNAATGPKVLAWLGHHAGTLSCRVQERSDLAMIAVQGPDAIAIFTEATGIDEAAELAPFAALRHDAAMVARTGYTGEDGVEVMLPGTDAAALWARLRQAGAAPTGLAARDTLRLEAGLNLYGQDMDEATTPLEANLGWTVAWEPSERDFIGRAALAKQRSTGHERALKGVVLEAKGVMRHGQRVMTSHGDGVITSGIYSPTLGYSIALARLPRRAVGGCTVDIRGKRMAARIVRPPFVRRGRKAFQVRNESR